MYQDSTPTPTEEEEKEDSDLELSDNADDDSADDGPIQYTYTSITERPERVPVVAPSAQLYPAPTYVAPPPVTYYYHSYYPASPYYTRYPFRYPLRCSGTPYYYCYP